MNEIFDNARTGGQPVWADVLLPEAMAEEITRMEADLQKIKSCYPSQVTTIRYMVEDTCDRLEYEGSPMFDELPDSATIHQLAQEIYVKVADDKDDEAIPCIAWGAKEQSQQCHDGKCRQPETVPAWNGGAGAPPHGCKGPGCVPPPPDCRGRGCVPPYVPDCSRGNCMLRQLIEVMLLDEMSHRRNRYHNRRRW